MNKLRKMELKNVFENINLEMEFTDLSEEEEQRNLEELKLAKEELKQLQ